MKKVVYSNFEFTQDYMITEDGRVFNATRGRFLKHRYDKDGYVDYTLFTYSGAKHFRAARISMIANKKVWSHIIDDIKN